MLDNCLFDYAVLFRLLFFFCGVVQIKQSQDGERKQLTELRDVLKASLQSEQKEVRKIKRRKRKRRRQGLFRQLSSRTSATCPQEVAAKQNAGYSLHQLQGNKAHGTERSGLLYKRSEG